MQWKKKTIRELKIATFENIHLMFKKVIKEKQKKKEVRYIKNKQKNGRCNSIILVITLNANELNSPIKGRNFSDLI